MQLTNTACPVSIVPLSAPQQEWARWLFQGGGGIYLKPKMYIDIAVLLVTSMLFGMLYDLVHVLYNPFGPRTMDLPHIAVGGGIRKVARSLATGDFLPPTMEPTTAGASLENIVEEDGFEDESESDILVDHLHTDGRGSLFAMLGKNWNSSRAVVTRSSKQH